MSADEQTEPHSYEKRSALAALASLSPEHTREQAEAKGFDARSTTTAQGRTVQVTLSADFARQIAYSLTERIVQVGEDTREGRWLAPFVADLAKVNP